MADDEEGLANWWDVVLERDTVRPNNRYERYPNEFGVNESRRKHRAYAAHTRWAGQREVARVAREDARRAAIQAYRDAAPIRAVAQEKARLRAEEIEAEFGYFDPDDLAAALGA